MAKARSLNKVMLIGNLTRDPVIKDTSNGGKVCYFGVATNTSWKDSNGRIQEKAEFHNIVAFNKLAEICMQVLAIGMLVYLEGELRTRVKEENGQKSYYTTIKLNDMLLIDNKGKTGVGYEEYEDDSDAEGESKQEKSKEEEQSDNSEGSEEDEFEGDELF